MKNGAATYFFKKILNLDKNADSIFLKIEGTDISSQISFTFRHRKANTFIKILKVHGKWKHENHFQYDFSNKIVATVLLAPLTGVLWFS